MADEFLRGEIHGKLLIAEELIQQTARDAHVTDKFTHDCLTISDVVHNLRSRVIDSDEWMEEE